MITEKTLKRWRKDSLLSTQDTLKFNTSNENNLLRDRINELHDRILRLTQELLDNHLVRK